MVKWLEQLLGGQKGPGSMPALAECFYSIKLVGRDPTDLGQKRSRIISPSNKQESAEGGD